MLDCAAAPVQSSPVAPRDPRLRPYRIAAWTVYFGIIVVLGGLIVGSIVRNLRGRPRHPAAAGALPTRASLRVCMTDIETLYREQNQQAWALGTEFEATNALGAWNEWSARWEQRVDDVSDRCRLDESAPGEEWVEERTEMAAARDAMLALHRAYRTQVNRFAQEEWDLARAANEAMAHARDAVLRSR